MALSTGQASAAIGHPDIVLENPHNNTPQLLATDAVPQPRVEGIAQLGGPQGRMFAGGEFTAVADSNGTVHNDVRHLMAFDGSTFRVDDGFRGVLNGKVLALEVGPDALYVGGVFSTVNGASRPKLAKLDPETGAVDLGFNARLRGGQVNDLELANGVLYVGGSTGDRLMALDPQTGANTGRVALNIADPIPNAWGSVSVYSFDVNPAGTQIAATGNFMTVAGAARTRFFLADINPATGHASLNPWYYGGFAKRCSATHARRLAYLQGIDFSPSGDYFVVVSTGQIPLNRSDIWHPGANNPDYTTVCDGAGRFDPGVANSTRQPTWINYTGGDSVWSVAATGAAVYVQGHFEWFDNPDGFASRCPEGDVCAQRLGIAALNSQTGLALPWDPRKPARVGGRAFLATDAGLWVGSDSQRFNGERRRGIAFTPLP